jgi:hypothetical protein
MTELQGRSIDLMPAHRMYWQLTASFRTFIVTTTAVSTQVAVDIHSAQNVRTTIFASIKSKLVTSSRSLKLI